MPKGEDETNACRLGGAESSRPPAARVADGADALGRDPPAVDPRAPLRPGPTVATPLEPTRAPGSAPRDVSARCRRGPFGDNPSSGISPSARPSEALARRESGPSMGAANGDNVAAPPNECVSKRDVGRRGGNGTLLGGGRGGAACRRDGLNALAAAGDDDRDRAGGAAGGRSAGRAEDGRRRAAVLAEARRRRGGG